jgi:hypothetical protein
MPKFTNRNHSAVLKLLKADKQTYIIALTVPYQLAIPIAPNGY